MRSQAERGLIALDSQHDDIRVRFVKYAADFFGSLAKGEAPSKPEPFVAELVADTCAKLIGAEVPMPLVDSVGRMKGKDGKGTALGEIHEVPEAETWLRSHNFSGTRKPSPSARIMLSAFLLNPSSWWRTRDLAARLGRTRASITRLAMNLRVAGLLVSEGTRNSMRWKLAEMPPHV